MLVTGHPAPDLPGLDEWANTKGVKASGDRCAVQPTQQPQNVALCGYQPRRIVIPRSVTPSPSKGLATDETM